MNITKTSVQWIHTRYLDRGNDATSRIVLECVPSLQDRERIKDRLQEVIDDYPSIKPQRSNPVTSVTIEQPNSVSS